MSSIGERKDGLHAPAWSIWRGVAFRVCMRELGNVARIDEEHPTINLDVRTSAAVQVDGRWVAAICEDERLHEMLIVNCATNPLHELSANPMSTELRCHLDFVDE